MSGLQKYGREFQDRAVRLYEERIPRGGISQTKARQEIGELFDEHRGMLRN